MKIAIIGGGISGLVAAYHLNKFHEITLFEAESWIGGHTHTVKYDGLNIDTGFIVFNDRTYPNFQKLLDFLDVDYRPTEMSFSVRNDSCGLEYNGNTINSLFSDRKNLLNPRFYRLLLDILLFNKLVKAGRYNELDTLETFIKKHNFSSWFIDGYLLPIGSAIWSMGTADMLSFPLKFFARFFINHGLLDIINRPQWYTVCGGSSQYIKPLINSFKDKIYLNSAVESVVKTKSGVLVVVNSKEHRFDKVVFACHSDQALKLLSQPSQLEDEVLSKIQYANNEVVLHTDISLLPKKKLAYASWNYLILNNSNSQATLTYDMNILQGLNAYKEYCVTLNSTSLINPNKILARFNYQHPVYSVAMVAAQQKVGLVSGVDNVHYCGAYWGNGFHEDGVVSALRVCQELGVEIAY